jgi:hypothetical protein
VIREVACARGVKLVNPAGVVPPGPRYFTDFVHFTNQGAEKMATAFADGLTPLVEAALIDRGERDRAESDRVETSPTPANAKTRKP